MKDHSKIACLILAGGEGKRVGGANKSQLKYKGQTLLQRQLGEIRKVTEDVVMAANNRFESVDSGLTFVEDKIGGLGPMDGIVGALELSLIHI